MIIDKTENWEQYHFGPVWEKAFVFLKTLTPQSEDKKYLIDGEDIFAIVMSYKTFAPETGVFESHRKYVDIQTVIVGAEGFECSFTDDLIIETPYTETAEAQFYKRSTSGQTRVDVFPGTFVMLYPHDAHMPGLMIDDEERVVKKVVIKIKKELLGRH